MLPTMEELLTEAERKTLTKSILELQRVHRYEDAGHLLCQIERWGAWLINGSAWLDFEDPTENDTELGELITTALAADLDRVYAICRNVAAYVNSGVKPARWTDPGDYDMGKIRAAIKAKKMDLGYGRKTYEELREEQEENRRKERERRRQIRHVPRHNHEREMALQLKEDPASRVQLGRSLNAIIKGSPETASGIQCPGCQRPSVWFFVSPDRKTSASCNHSNSCSWYGSLYDLARLS